jgi:hypothetical protein
MSVADRSELVRALGALLEAPRDELAPVAEALGLPELPDGAEHTRVFLLNLYPYASVQLGAEGMLGGETRDRVAGFWGAVGLVPPVEPDHLGAMLGLWASLLDRRDDAVDEPARLLLDRAQAALVEEHLLPWVPFYLARVEEVGGEFYGAWAGLLQALMVEAAVGWDHVLPAHMTEAPELGDPRVPGIEGGRAWLESLLVPARTGMILIREDLTRCGRETGLGVRMGERAYTLKALMGQQPRVTLRWLADEARRQSEMYRDLEGIPESLVDFWLSRATATIELLEQLASSEALSDWEEQQAASPDTEETHHA